MDWVETPSDGEWKMWIEHGAQDSTWARASQEKAMDRYQRVVLLSVLEKWKRRGSSLAVTFTEYGDIEQTARKLQKRHPLLKNCTLISDQRNPLLSSQGSVITGQPQESQLEDTTDFPPDPSNSHSGWPPLPPRPADLTNPEGAGFLQGLFGKRHT